jgi:hypothetical protein
VDAPVVGFLGVLFGSLMTLLVAHRTADYAVQLWETQRKAKERALLRAVIGEIDGTLRLTYLYESGRLVFFHRSAWDAAREVTLPDGIFASLSEAYARADVHNALLETLLALLSKPDYDTRSEQAEVRRLAIQEIRPLFQAARFHLATHLGLGPPWNDPVPPVPEN